MHADDERASLRRDAVVLTSWWVAGGGEGTSGDRLDEEKILILSVAEYFCRRRLDRPLANYQKTAKWGENMGRAVLAILLLTAFGACAGRTPQPVAVVQPQDRYADCGAIIAEVQADNAKISELAGDEGSKVAQNVAAGVVGLFIWPVWFGMDFQGAAGKEISALQSRQQYLAVLAEQKNCGVATTPMSPAPVAASSSAPSPAFKPVAIAAPAVTPAPAAAAPASLSSPPGAWPNFSAPPPAPSAPSAAPEGQTSPLTTTGTPSPVSNENSYERALQQYRQAEQLYQRQLEEQRAR